MAKKYRWNVRVDVIGYNLVFEDGVARDGSIPRLRCNVCGAEWWAIESPPPRHSEECYFEEVMEESDESA